jgi:hypothetical protein
MDPGTVTVRRIFWLSWKVKIWVRNTADVSVRSNQTQSCTTANCQNSLSHFREWSIFCKNGRNGYSARNYQLMDEESTWWMLIQPAITSQWTRNLPEKWLFRQESAHRRWIHRWSGYSAGNYKVMDEESPGGNGYSAGNYLLMNEESTVGMGFRLELPAHIREIQGRSRVQPGITSSNTRSLPEERDSAVKYQLMDADQNARKFFRTAMIPGSVIPIALNRECQL